MIVIPALAGMISTGCLAIEGAYFHSTSFVAPLSSPPSALPAAGSLVAVRVEDRRAGVAGYEVGSKYDGWGYEADRVRMWTSYLFDFGRGGNLDVGLVGKYDSPTTFSFAATRVPLSDQQLDAGANFGISEFGFCLALVAYNLLAVVLAALRSVHGEETVDEEVSLYYIANEISMTYYGMMIAIPEREWDVFYAMRTADLAAILMALARGVCLQAFRKSPRRPQKPRSQDKKPARRGHVSTAKLLRNRKAILATP